MDHGFGIVQYFGSDGRHKCSYCNSEKETSDSLGMTVYNLSEESYQLLIDRGWRRSGSYCYKMVRTDCCAFYTIRCDALKFELTKSKRKVLKRMNNFLKSDSLDSALRNMNKRGRQSDDLQLDYEAELQLNKRTKNDKVDFNLNNIEDQTDDKNDTSNKISDKVDKVGGDKVDDKAGDKMNDKPIKKAKNLKQNNSKKISQSLNNQQKIIDIEQLKQSTKKKPKRILRCLNKIKSKHNCTDDEAIDLMIKQRRSNRPENTRRPLSLEDHFRIESSLANKLKIKVVLANDESAKQSHDLYKKYQKIIHKSEDSDLSYSNFYRFLVANPFPTNKASPEWNVDDEELPNKYGCYHMQYWLNDKLIGVNVIDILPKCVSSVYFFYDPDYSALNLGTYSSLREIDLVRKLNKCNPSIKYYYMGFYIHSCIKMRYKGNINSSYLLCPETFKFYDYDWCLENFDLTKLNRLTKDQNVVDSEGMVDLNKICVLYKQTASTYKYYVQKFVRKSDDPEFRAEQRNKIEEYAKSVGQSFVPLNLYYISD